MEMPKPTAAHQRLNLLAGKWKGEEKMHPSPWDPQGGVAEAKIDNQLILDGFAIAQNYAQVRGGQVSFTGHCVMSYHAAAKEYPMHWWDSMGTFDLGKAGVGRYSFKMEVAQDGQQWAPFMDGNYVRA